MSLTKSDRNRLLSKIHIAKKHLGLDDEAYRAVLERITGKVSCSAMIDRELEAVCSELQRLGWKPKRPRRHGRSRSDKPYVRKLFALAGSLDRRGYWKLPYKEGLRRFVKEMTGIDDPEWLTYEQASPVIEALKTIEGRLS